MTRTAPLHAHWYPHSTSRSSLRVLTLLTVVSLLVAPLLALTLQSSAQASGRTILVFSKAPYTDPGEEDAEITAALEAEFGASNVTVTDGGDASAATWTGLLVGVDTLVIPETDSGSIWEPGRTTALRVAGAETWPITDEAMAAIKAWAEAGGVIMGTGSYSHRSIIQYLTGTTYSVWWDDYPGNYVRGPGDVAWQTWDNGWFSRLVSDTSIPERLPGGNWTGGMTIAYTDSANPGNNEAWGPAERATVTIVYGYSGPHYWGPATQTIEQIGVGVFTVGQGSYIYYAYDWYPDADDRNTAYADPTHTEWWNLALVLGAGGQISAAAGSGTPTTTTTTTASVGSGPIRLSDGTVPALPPGTGFVQAADGSTVPLRITSPTSRVVRYESDGLRVTLTGARGTDATRGLVATPEGTIECEVCAVLAAGGVIEAWMFSDPRLAAAWRVDETAAFLAGLPCQRFTIPVGAPLDGRGPVPAGLHTLQLQLPTATAGTQAVNIGVTVGSLTPRAVPAGEGSEHTAARTAALSALTSMLLMGVLMGRRRRVGRAG